jgi:hypothetical protein
VCGNGYLPLAKADRLPYAPSSEHGARDPVAEEVTTIDPGDMGKERPSVLRRLLRAFVSADSYGLVLLLIVMTYALSVSQQEWARPIVLLIQIVTVWFTLRTSRTSRAGRWGAIVVFAVAAVVAVVGILWGTRLSVSAGLLASSLLYLIAPVAIIRHLVSRPTVDQETLLGAVAAYLLVGMSYGFLYRFLGVAQAGPLFGSEGEGTMSQALFFSFTTLTTTGYGNLVPQTNPGQAFAVAEMLIGQLFLITAVGKVITAWRPSRWSAGTAPPSDEEV